MDTSEERRDEHRRLPEILTRTLPSIIPVRFAQNPQRQNLSQVCTVQSPTYALAKEVTKVLSPLVGNTSSYVKDAGQRSTSRHDNGLNHSSLTSQWTKLFATLGTD